MSQIALYSLGALFTAIGTRFLMQKHEFPGVNFRTLFANLMMKTFYSCLGSKISVLDKKASRTYSLIETDSLKIETLPLSYDSNASELYLTGDTQTCEYIIRVYQPKQYREGGYPILMYAHGGGWMLGSIDTSDDFCQHVSNSGFIVVSIDYRKTPQFIFPSCLNDCLNALSWIGKNYDKYNGNIKKLIISGDSAGGHLSIHTQIRIFSLENNVLERECIPNITHQALLYPATEIYQLNDTKYQTYVKYWNSALIVNASMVDMFWKQLIGNTSSIENAKSNQFLSVMSARDPLSNIELYSKFPKGFVWLAEYDVLRDEGEVFAKSINKSTGDDKRIEIYEWKEAHGFLSLKKEVTYLHLLII